MSQETVELDSVIVRFAGDSGDGMQLVGSQFSVASAIAGNDLSTLPDYPAEIRAPAGTVYGVSGFQIQFSHGKTLTPGDHPDTLVAMNPAALKTNVSTLKAGGTIIANADAFTERNMSMVGYETNPLEDGSLEDYSLIAVKMTSLTVEAVKESGLKGKNARRCTNFFALGLICSLYGRPLDATEQFIDAKFAGKPEIQQANTLALNAGVAYAESTEALSVHYQIKPAELDPGLYRSIEGNKALAYGLVTAAEKSGLQLVLASYPITPATSILEELAALRHMGVKTLQMEDEIAGIGAALGASWAGSLGVTTTSGPGVCLKSEFIGLALIVELPLVIVDVQRGGPSTGLPTKTEQSDLMMAMYGRHGDSSIPIIAAKSPSDAFDCAIEATRIATKYMTPVFLMTDGYIANGAEPWSIPNPKDIPEIPVVQHTDPETFQPYKRDPLTLARPWAVPGTPGCEHRLGGLEKENITGDVCTEPENHALMTKLRHDKVEGIARDYPAQQIEGVADSDLLVVSWGSTYGSVSQAVEAVNHDDTDKTVAHVHLRYINPLPADLGEIIKGYKKVIVPEVNNGQFVHILRDKYLVDAQSFARVYGRPLAIDELRDEFISVLSTTKGAK